MDKQQLIALTKELLNEENLDNRNEDLQFLRRQYKFYLGRDEDSYFEQEETDEGKKAHRHEDVAREHHRE